MRVHILTRVILAFADCLLYSESQETANGPTQHLSPNLTLSPSTVKTAVNQTSLNQVTNGNSSVTEEVVRYLSPFKVVKRHRPLYVGTTHTFPVRVASRSHLPTEGLSVPMEGRPNNSTSMEAPQNSSSPISKMTQHYSHGSVENHHSMSNSTVPQSSPPISWAASNFLPLPRKTQLSSLPVSRTTKPAAANSELSLRPVVRHSLPTMKESNQSSFIPDSENYSSSFSILSGRPRSTLVERNSFNVDQDKSNHSSAAPTSDLLSVKSARRSLPLSFGFGNLPRTKVIWNKSHELKPYPHIPYNSFENDQYLLANGRTDASQSPWNTGTSPLYPQTQSSSSMFGSPPLHHSPSSPEATSGSTRDNIIRSLDSNGPISSVNTNSETPRLKNHEEKVITNGVDFTIVGGNEVTHTEETTAIADATRWDKKISTAVHHATGYFPNPENLANDFLKDSINALPDVHNFLDAGTYKEEREGVGMDLANAAPSVVEDNLIIIDNTDLLEEDFRALMNNLEFLGEDDFMVIYVPDWEEDYLTEDDDPIVLKEDDIDEVKTRILTKGMISRTKLPIGIRGAAIPRKDIAPLTTLREIPEDGAVPTSNAVNKDVATNPINDASIFFPKIFMRKSSTPVANSDKHLASTTVTKNGLPARDPITSEVNDILSVRDSETPIQQIILTQFKPEIILPENENNATANAPTVLLENTTTHDKDVTYVTQLRGENSVTEHEINTTIPTVRISSLTNVGTRLIPDVAVSMMSTADPLLNSHTGTPVKEPIIKDYNTITTMEDYSTTDKGQRILSSRVIPRSSIIIPKEDIKATVYGLPRMDETFADGDTALKSDMILSAKEGTVVAADKVILAEKNTPKDNTLRTFILDDNDPKSSKDDSFLPQVNPVEHLVDRTKHITNPIQSDPTVAISTAYISPSTSDRTLTTSRKVYSSGSDDIIALVEENSESEIKAPIFQMFRDDPNSRDMTSRSMGGGKTSNWAKTSIEENTATENKLRSIEEYYGGSEKSIVPNIIPTSFAYGSHNDAFDIDDSDTMGFYSFQKEYNTTFFPFGDRATVPKGFHSFLTQALDSKVDPTPLLYEMTDSDPNVPLTSIMKNLKPMANRNMPDVTTDGTEEIIFKDQETATVKQNDEAAEDIKFFLPENSIPRIRRKDYTVLSDTDHGPVVRQTAILLDDNIKPAVFLPKTSIATNMEVATDSTIKPSEKAPPKETEESTLTMNYINAKHNSTAMEGADPAKPILLTANTFEPNVSSAKLQETFHEKEGPFPHATRQISEVSAMNSAKTKDATIPEWQITERDYNMLPSETALFPAALTPMTESISGESKTTSIVNGNHATQDGGVSEFRRTEKSTIPERTLPAFRKNIVTVIDTTKDESENGETFEYEVIPYVERTTTTEEEEYIPKDDQFIDFSPTSDDVFDALVTKDDSIFPETDSASPSTDIFANSPKLIAFEDPEGNFVSDATKSLPKMTSPGLKEIIIRGQHSTAVPDTASFLPKISHLEEKRSIDKDTAHNLVSSFTPAYAMPLTSNSADSATDPIALEDEGVSVTKSTPSSSNNELSLTVRTITQAALLKAHEDDDSSTVAEITKSQKGTRTMTSATDPDTISHTDDVIEFVRSLTTPPSISLIKTATLVKSEAPVVSTENTEPKDGPVSLKVNVSSSMGDKDVLTTTDAPRIFTYDSVPEKVQGPFPIKPTWTETIGNKFASAKSPAITPEWFINEPQILVPANPSLGRVHASYSAPVPATIMVPGNSAVGDETSSLLLDNTTVPSSRVLPMVATTVSKGNSRNTGDVSKYELKPSVEKDKAIEPETLLLTEGPTIMEANDATLPTKNVRENVDRMITPLHDNVPKDYSSISEDSRIALKTADTKPIMDIVPLTYGSDEFEALAPNSLSRITIIIPNDVKSIENYHAIFIGENNSDTEADKGNFIGDSVNLKAVHPGTMDDSNFSQTESSTTASLNVVAIAANDVDFLPDMSKWRVKKTLFSFAPDAVLDRNNKYPYTTDSTNSNSKDKIPLVKNDDRPATYNTVGLQAASTTTEADARTQEDETNTSGPKLIKFPLGMDPVTSFTDSVIDDLPNEREAPLTNPMTKGAITQRDRAASAVANGILLPGKDDNVERQFIIPGADTPRSIGDTPLVTSETLLLLPDVTADEVQLSFFTEEHPLTDASMIVASKLSETMVETMETINEDTNPGHQIFGSQRDPWPLPLENKLPIADPTSSGLFSSNMEDSASNTGNRVATTETDRSGAPRVTSDAFSLLPDTPADETQLSVIRKDPLTEASRRAASEVREALVENIDTIKEDANPEGQIFESQRYPWALPHGNRLLKADSISTGVFSRNFKDSASTTGNRIAATETDSSDAPLVTSETLSLLPDEAQLSILRDDPLTDASMIVVSEVWEPLPKNIEIINEDANPERQIFGSQRHPWPLPAENRLLTADPTSSGLFSSNMEDSASTTGNIVATMETDGSDAPLATYDTLSLLPDEVQLSVFTEEDPLTDTSMKITSDMWEPLVENIETINEDANPDRQIFGSQRDPWALPLENRLLTANPISSGLFSRNFEDSASTTGNRVAITETDTFDSPLVTYDTLSLLPDEVQLSVFTEEDPLTDTSMKITSDMWEPLVENIETINEDANPDRQIFGSQRDPWALPLENRLLTANPISSGLFSRNFEDSASTTGNRVAITETDTFDSPLVTYDTLSLLPDEAQLSVLRDDPLIDASLIVVFEVWEPLVENIDIINEDANPEGQIFGSQRDPWALPLENSLFTANPTSSGLFSSNFEDSASTTGNRVSPTKMDSSDAPLVTSETLSLLPDEAQLSIFKENPLTDTSMIVPSRVSESVVENTGSINEDANPGRQIFDSQRDPWALPLGSIVLPDNSPSYKFSPTSSEHSSPTMAAAMSMPVKNIASSIDSPRNNSERLFLETVPSEKSSYTGVETADKEEIVTEAEGKRPYGTAYNDFASDSAVDRTGVNATNSLLIPTLNRKNTVLRRERAGIESNGTKSPNDNTNSTPVATGTLVKVISGVQEIAFVEEKSGEADKVAASFLPDTRYLPVGDTSPSTTDSTASSSTMPSHEVPASSKNAAGSTGHTSGAPATVTTAGDKAHAKEGGTAAAEMTNPQKDILPVTSTSIPAAEGILYVEDGTEIVATVPSAHTEYTEARNNWTITEGNPLSIGYGHQLSTRHFTLPSYELHAVHLEKQDSVDDVIRTPTERRKIETEKLSAIDNPNSPDTPFITMTTTFQNTDTTVHASGPEYETLVEEDSRQEPKGRKEEDGDNSILEVANITPFLSHDSTLQRDDLAPEGYLINSEEDTAFTLDPNRFRTHRGYSLTKTTNSPPEIAASKFEEIIMLEKDGLADTDTDFLLADISYPGSDPTALEKAKTPMVSSRDLLLASTKTEAFPSKDMDSFDNKIAHGEDPSEISGAEIKKIQEAVAAPMTFFIIPKANISYVGTYTEPLMEVTATSAFVPTKRSTPAISRATIFYVRYFKPQNDTTVSEANSTLVSTGDTTLLTTDTLNFNPVATAGISPETFHLKERSLDVADVTMSKASGPVSEKPLPVNGALTPEWNVLSVQSDPRALQLESTLPHVDSTVLLRNPAYTDPDTVGTVKEDPLTETASSGEKYPSPKRAISAAAPFNLREDPGFRIGATPYEADAPIEEIASGEQEAAFHRVEEDAVAEEDDITQERENTPYSTYFSPFMSGNDTLEDKNSDPEDGSVFHEANNNHVITDAINPLPQITTNGETKASNFISPRDEKPPTVVDSTIQTADDNIKTITADPILDGMIKATTEFKGVTNTEQNYSEPEDMTYLPDVADLSIKRKAQRDGDVGPDVDSPLASKDTRPPKAGSTGPVSFATPLEDKDNSTFVPKDYAINNVAGAKSPKQETETAEMADSQNDISPMTSFTAPVDVRMPYTNTGNEYRKDLAANAAIPLTWKAPVMVAKNVMLPSESVQPNSESAASEVGTATSTGGGPLTALAKPTHERLPPSNKPQINHHGRDKTPITFEASQPGSDNSLPNDATTLGQPLTKMGTDLPTLPPVAALLPDDSSRYTIKAIYTRHAAVPARKEEARAVSMPDILHTPNNVPGADIRDGINPSGYQPDIIIEESASMEFDEIPFVEEDTSAEGDVIYLEEENNSDDDLMTFVLDNNVSDYVTEDYTIAPLSPIINTPTLTHEPSELGTYASYNKADSSYSSSEIATANPTETKSKETSHTVILEYEPTDSEIHTTMLKSVAPRTIAYSSSDGSKKISSRFLKMTTKEQNNKVVDDATTFLPEPSNPKKKRTDSSFAVDPDTGFQTEESETFTKGTVGSAGEPASIKNKETLDTNTAADVFTSGRNISVTPLEEKYSKNNLKIVGSDTSTSQDSTSPSELLMSHGADRISHMDENMETVTEMVTTANMPATEKVASVGVLPVQDGDSPIPKADVTMFLDNNPLLTHAKPSLPPDAKIDNAEASLQGKNEALLDDYFLVLEETETVVEPTEVSTEYDTNVPEITLLSKDANRLVSENNVIHFEESLSYDTDLVGGAHSNSEDNYITLEPDAFYLNVIMNSHLTNTNGPETIAFRDPITAGEKNKEDELYAKNLPTDKPKVPMETITMTDVITDGIKTTPQEITPGKESNRAAVQVVAFEPDMPHSETRVSTHKDSHIVSDWDPAFTRTGPSSFRTESTGLAENITSPESQETVIPKDYIDPRAERMITATDATSEEKEENGMAEITNLEKDVTPTSFISPKIEDTEPAINSGIADVITAEEETPTPLYNEYIKPEDGPIVSGANSVPVSTDDITLLNDATVGNTQETLPLKEMSLDDADMTVSEASGPISEESLPANGALIPEQNVISVQSDPQAPQLESTLPPADSTLLPRTPPYTDTDTVGTVKEDPATETATSGEKYPSPKRAISAAAIINLREHTDFMIETARYEADIFVEEIISGKHGAAFQREEENTIAEEDGVTQEKENTLYATDFPNYISSSNILMGNELDPQDYSTFPKREDVNSVSEVNKITTDLSKCVAQPVSPQNSIPTVTSFSVPGAERISFENQDSKTPLSYSDLTGDMSFMAQANPIVAKVLTPTSLPTTSGDDVLISRSATAKFSEDTTLSMDTISILEDEFTSEKVQDTPQAKDGSLADLKKAKSAYLLNLVTDHSAPMNNLGIREGSITKTPTHLHAFPSDASRKNTVSIVDSTNTEYDPSTTREENTTSELSIDAITTSPGSSFLEEKFPLTSAAEVMAEDPSPKVYPPTPTTHITRNITEETISSVSEDATPEVQTAIISEAHLTSVDDSIPESDIITTAVNFMNTFSDFISSVTDKLPLLRETPTSEFNTKLHHIETPTPDAAEGVSSIKNTAMLSAGVTSLTEEEVISYETGSISSTSNDAFLMNNDDDATDPANEVSDFMMQDLEEEKITVLDRTIPSKEDDSNAMAKVNGFMQKDDITEEKDMFSVADLTNSEKEDTTMSDTSNFIEENTAADNWLWMEGNPEDELNATVLILNASKNKDSSALFASKAKNTYEDKNTMKAFLRKLVGGPTESVTNVTDSYPTSPPAGHPIDSREDSTTATDVTNLKQDDSKDTL